MKAFKISAVIIATIIIVLIIGNPSLQGFKEYAPERNNKLTYAVWRRVNNYVVFSVYAKDYYEINHRQDGYELVSSQEYVGFLFNFRSKE